MTVDSAAATTTTSGRVYPVAVDKSGYLSVSVPWTAVTETTVRNWGFTKNEGTLTDVDLFVGGPDAKEDGATTNGNTYLNLLMNSGIRSVHNIVGSGHTTVTSDASGTITINSTVPDISNLVPYTGASKDVNLGNHSLLISDQTSANGAMVKVSGKYRAENDTSITIKPSSIELTDPRSNGLKATLAAGKLSIADDTYTGLFNKGGFKAQLREDTDGDGQLDATYYSTYVYDGIVHNGNKLSFQEKEGTIALTSDLSTLLDKGASSSSSIDFQTVYNPVTFMQSTATPSIHGLHTSIGAVGFPWELGGTTSTSSVSSALTLRGYEDSLKKECYTILKQDGNEFSIKAKSDSMSSILSYNGQWRIGGYQIVTADMMPGTQQWKLTSTSGTVTTVNICTK